MKFEEAIAELQSDWRERQGRVRAGSAVDLLIKVLAGVPVLTVKGVADLIGRSFQATNQGIARPIEAEVLSQVNIGRRNRAFEAADVIEIFTALERQLATDSATRDRAPSPNRGRHPPGVPYNSTLRANSSIGQSAMTTTR